MSLFPGCESQEENGFLFRIHKLNDLVLNPILRLGTVNFKRSITLPMDTPKMVADNAVFVGVMDKGDFLATTKKLT